jgi:hypothetical protein
MLSNGVLLESSVRLSKNEAPELIRLSKEPAPTEEAVPTVQTSLNVRVVAVVSINCPIVPQGRSKKTICWAVEPIEVPLLAVNTVVGSETDEVWVIPEGAIETKDALEVSGRVGGISL